MLSYVNTCGFYSENFEKLVLIFIERMKKEQVKWPIHGKENLCQVIKISYKFRGSTVTI